MIKTYKFGISLTHIENQLVNESCIDIPTFLILCVLENLNIFFVDRNTPTAQARYESLLEKYPDAQKVRYVNNLFDTIKRCVARSKTNKFWVISSEYDYRDFDFNWQPNIMQSRRHYIFKATNIVNNLEYGHMAIVANNKILTLQTKGYGLDFTMDSPTEVVNINSGVSTYNSSPYDAWRTAFREMIKLCCNDDQESIDRGAAWLNKGNDTIFGDYSKLGARDAVDYYNEVGGDMEKLMLSYDWEWLANRFKDV